MDIEIKKYGVVIDLEFKFIYINFNKIQGISYQPDKKNPIEILASNRKFKFCLSKESTIRLLEAYERYLDYGKC